VVLQSSEREKVRLISREIIFQEFQNIITIIPQRYRQTDGRTDAHTTCLGNTALCVASRGKRYARRIRQKTGHTLEVLLHLA